MMQNVFAGTLDRFGGHGPDGQTLGNPNLLRGTLKNKISSSDVCVSNYLTFGRLK